MTGLKKTSHTDLLNLARLLLQKSRGFCIYRFPGEENYNLAAEKDLFKTKNPQADFIVSPFTMSTGYREVVLQKIADDKSFASLLKTTEKLPQKEIAYGVLPIEFSQEDYLQKIGRYLEKLKSGSLQKAILSRVKRISTPDGFDNFEFFQSLCKKYPETFCYLLYLPGNGLWAGASPELLLNKEGKNYKTMALAGTLPLGNADSYKWREKEEEEHDLVRLHIENTFAQNGFSLLLSKGPYNFETGSVAHLRTDFAFREGSNSTLAKILNSLHPTPAIGGLPVEEALDLIEKTEGYNRSYYTGYLGEINGNRSARLFINLRCMQIGEKEIALYLGGGITADSNPLEEWKETEQKSNTLLKVIEENSLKGRL